MKFESIQQKAKRLFGKSSRITGTLSDLAVTSGIPHYMQAIPNMTPAEARTLISYAKKHQAILDKPVPCPDGEPDLKKGLLYHTRITRHTVRQRKSVSQISRLLNKIIARGDSA